MTQKIHKYFDGNRKMFNKFEKHFHFYVRIELQLNLMKL